MKQKLLVLLAIPLLLVTMFIGKVSAEAPQPEVPLIKKTSWTKEEVKDLVDKYADKYGVSRYIMQFVVNCESSYNYKAVNWSDSHKLSKGSHGVMQYSQQTYEGFAKQMGKTYNDPYNAEESIDVGAWAISKGYGNHWSCYRKLAIK